MKKVDTLIIIGNGFDIWQGLDTSYDKFEDYYHKHLDEILSKLKIKKYKAYGKDGEIVHYSDVELFYGNPFQPDKLSHDFWYTFEASLDKLDDQQLNLYFGKTRDGLKGIKRSAKNARRILTTAFCDWISTIRIDEKDTGYRFGDNCLFINFNYTDTLRKRFHVDKTREYHIHGEATDKSSIIFGHATHPEYPLSQLYRMGGRFRGLYYLEEALYNADKHVEDNYTNLCMYLALQGISVSDIKNIYVLGHSFGEADIGYFRNLINATQGNEVFLEEITEEEKLYMDHLDFAGMMNLNIQYAIHHRERALGIRPISYPKLEKLDVKMFQVAEDSYYRMQEKEQYRLEAAAVHRRFLEEQALRDARVEKRFLKTFRRVLKNNSCGRYEKKHLYNHVDSRSISEEKVKWHISYYSSDDKERIETVMKDLGCRNYQLYPGIDECIKGFGKSEK